MAKKSIDKGKRGELEARDEVRRHWHSPNCIRSAQAGGSYAADLLEGPPGLHLEVKRYKSIAAFRFLDQATKDVSSGDVPVVLLKEDGGKWAVLFYIEDTRAFRHALARAQLGDQNPTRTELEQTWEPS